MNIKIKFEIDETKYKEYQCALENFLELIDKYKTNDSEIVIHEYTRISYGIK